MAGFHGRADGPVNLQVVPYPALTVFIDFGDMLLFDSAAGGQTRGSVVVGVGAGSIRAEVCKRAVECLQIRLSPVAAHAVLSTSSELGGMVVSLEELWGRDALRTQERLHDAASWDHRFAIMEAVLTQRRETGRAVDPEVAFIWGQIVTSRGRVRIERLAAEVGWSRKRLWSRFRAQIGLTPKRAARLVRFDHAAHRLAAGHSAAVVAAESGFADQSHLHWDVMAFAGLTPTAVAGAPWLAVDDVAWPAPERSPGCDSHRHARGADHQCGTF
ncbi:MAG: AraC family transcriptional regulator, partial [Mycobacterium sp.]|nr:AraC family transcriptional regulator [Mycobacterium sp.]